MWPPRSPALLTECVPSRSTSPASLSAPLVARLEDGREVVVDLADIRQALATKNYSPEEQNSEAAK